MKTKAGGFGRIAAEKIDESRAAVAGGLDTAANALHEKAHALPGGQRVAGAAQSAVEGLTTGAEYIRDHDARSMMQDLQGLIKRNPGVALLGAAVLGFLVVRAFSRE